MRHIAAATLIAAVVLAGCGADQNTGQIDHSPGAYPQTVQGKLLGACSGAYAGSGLNLPSGYCECAMRQLEANLPASSVANENDYVVGESMLTDPDIRGACAHK